MSLFIINKFHQKFESLDIETIWDNGIAKPICISITKGKKIKYKMVEIKDIDKNYIIEFLLENCSKKKIYYVHNLTFEAFVFINYLIKYKIKFKLLSNDKTVYSLIINDIVLKCSYRLTMLSLNKLSELAKCEKKGVFPYKILNTNIKEYMDIDEDMFNNKDEFDIFIKKNGNKNVNIYKILREYCENDSIITKNSIIKYWEIIEENGLIYNKKILTAARLSIENYFKMDGIKIKKKINIRNDRLIRKGYFGGRTEVFGNLDENEIALHFDWSGMYAKCMCEKVLGGEIEIKSKNISNFNKPGYYWIKYEQNMNIPILPIKNDKLLFINGVLEGWYWFEEILLAIEYGVKIKEIKGMISSEYYEKFIEKFVIINNKIREKGGLYNQIGKNNNNSFYGRLGMNPERLEEYIGSEYNGDDFIKSKEINNVFIGYKKSEKKISNVLVAASITSKARIRLYKGMMDVLKEGGRILYTDTDSIIAAFKKDIYKEKLDKEIGEVYFDSKKEDTIIVDGVFAMPKTYAIKYLNGKEIVKIKGFKTLPSFNEMKTKFYNKEEIITKNIIWIKKDFNIRQEYMIKKTNLNSLDKRKWDNSMKYTEPLYLNK